MIEEALVYPDLLRLDGFQKILIIVYQSTHHVVFFITTGTLKGKMRNDKQKKKNINHATSVANNMLKSGPKMNQGQK